MHKKQKSSPAVQAFRNACREYENHGRFHQDPLKRMGTICFEFEQAGNEGVPARLVRILADDLPLTPIERLSVMGNYRAGRKARGASFWQNLALNTRMIVALRH